MRDSGHAAGPGGCSGAAARTGSDDDSNDRSNMPRLYDITLRLREGMLTYPDNPPFEARPHTRIAAGEDANVSRVSFGTHTGTHVDAAQHFVEGGQPVDELPLDVLLGPAQVLEIGADTTAIGEQELRAAGFTAAERLLLKTRNGALLEQDEFTPEFAHLTGDGAAFLVAAGVRLVGIDYLSVEGYGADEPHAHLTLLEQRIVILEGIDLREVPPGTYELLCLPLPLAGLDGAPARAVLRA
jgi:arylformamidase